MVGNESERHLRYKRKVADILRAHGYTVAGDSRISDDEFCICRPGSNPPYFVDLCASNHTRILIVEIDGFKGHKTRRGILKDIHRFAEIKELITDVECYRFSFWQLKGMDNETIALELGLTSKGRDNK